MNIRFTSLLLCTSREMLPRPRAVLMHTSLRTGSMHHGLLSKRLDACALSRTMCKRFGVTARVDPAKSDDLVMWLARTSSPAASTTIVMTFVRKVSYTRFLSRGFRALRYLRAKDAGGDANCMHTRRMVLAAARTRFCAPVPTSRCCPSVPHQIFKS